MTDEPLSDPIDDVLVVDPIAEMYIIGCTIDYVSELGGSFLKISKYQILFKSRLYFDHVILKLSI